MRMSHLELFNDGFIRALEHLMKFRVSLFYFYIVLHVLHCNLPISVA